MNDIHNDSGREVTIVLKNQMINTPTLMLNGTIKPRPTLLPYQKLSMVKKSMLGEDYGNGELKLEKLKSISHKYDGGSFKELYPM